MSNFQDIIPTTIKVEDDLLLNRTTLDSAQDNIDMVWANMERFSRFPWANENYNLESFERWINSLELRPNLCEFDYRKNKALIGRVSIRLEEDYSIGFGYLLSSEAEGYGYISRAVKASITLLNGLGYKEFGVMYNQNNARSRAVAMRNGFIEIGPVANPNNIEEISFIKARLII